MAHRRHYAIFLRFLHEVAEGRVLGDVENFNSRLAEAGIPPVTSSAWLRFVGRLATAHKVPSS